MPTVGCAGKYRFIATFSILFFLLTFKLVFAEEGRPAENLPRLIDTAISVNPELKASDARWQIFRNRIAQVSSFEDPMLMLKIQNGVFADPFNFRKDPMTQKVIGISQQIPFWGKRALKGEMATKEAESYKWQVEERKLELKKAVAEIYYQIYYIDKSREIVDRNINILDEFITLANTKYSVGKGTQQDIFRAQVERSKMLDIQITLEQQRKSLQAGMNALLYRQADTPVGRIPEVEIEPLFLTSEQLRNNAYENRPLLKAYQARIDKGKAGLKLAAKEFYPDVNAVFEYMQRDRFEGSSGDDLYTVGFAINLPVQRERRHAAVAESGSEIRMATEELNSLKNSINGGVADLQAQLDRRQKLVDLYKTGLIPQAQESLKSATIGYRVNKVDFLTLLDNRVTLYNYEREYYASITNYQVKKAQLEALTGKELK